MSQIYIIGVIFCAIFFIYQSYELLSLYLSGKTIAETRVERFRYSQIPALTICLPTFLAADKIKNSSEYHQSLYEIFIEHDDIKWRIGAFDEMRRKFYPQFLKTPVRDLFDKFSLDDFQIVPEYTNSKAFSEQAELIELPRPIQHQSLVPFNDARKCFTLFSGFDENFAKHMFEMKYLELGLRVSNLSYPPELFNQDERDLHIAVHSPTSLPEFSRENILLEVKTGMVQFVTYSESKVILLPPPYLTNCKNYDLKREGMRTDCINRCVDREISKMFGMECIWTYCNYRLVTKLSLKNSNKTFCQTGKLWRSNRTYVNKVIDEMVKFEFECQTECPRNCLETYYDFKVLNTTDNSDYDTKLPNVLVINLKHNRLMDMVIEHKPIMDWNTMVSNLGGLLGMWLGWSVRDICNQFIEKVHKSY